MLALKMANPNDLVGVSERFFAFTYSHLAYLDLPIFFDFRQPLTKSRTKSVQLSDTKKNTIKLQPQQLGEETIFFEWSIHEKNKLRANKER